MDIQSKNGYTVNSFVRESHVRLTWIAFFTLWVLWGLVYFLRHALSCCKDKGTAAAEDAEAGESKAKESKHHKIGDRLANAHRVLFENTLLLLSVLVLNTLGAGSTRAVLILTWIYFGFTVIHAFTEIGVDHHFVRLFFNLVFYGITLAIGGLAFSHGW
ncbi:uncharacterized protein BYT42DRAFT_565711 [Radiomyces spectabilis]|uniref:uncharacterized protein n=1 Tax=Radiomyces spectabilis TaxID=64574 RepID=UPI00221F7F18|nr:uncharacterized protein BYT42DRAFT_565711 [Radiomyces spectabilis]KAI8381217.1 hypothetical protein BYT42DRAFT_565711 [Radiomyces spectabilis]